jgi:drug/metabolite transporter (DMT)-like permease
MSSSRTGLAAGLAVIVLWASAFPAIEVAVEQLGAAGLSLARLTIASIALVIVAPALRVGLPQRRDLGWIAACGFFGMFAYQLLLNEAELHVPAGVASIIICAAPLVSIAVARVLFAEPIHRTAIIGAAIALAGITIVCAARAGLSINRATWTVVGAMIVQGIYHPLQRPLLSRYRSIEVATYSMIAGTAMTAPLLPFALHEFGEATPSAWAGAVWLGMFPSAIGFVLWGMANRELTVATATSLLYLVPPVAVIIAWIWLGDRPSVIELLAGCLVLIGVVVVTRGTRVGPEGETLLDAGPGSGTSGGGQGFSCGTPDAESPPPITT